MATPRGTVTIGNKSIPATYVFPAWNGLVGGARLAPGRYPWTLTLSKSGYDPVTVTGRIIVCDRYSMFSGTGSGTAAGTTKTYAKSLLAKPVACLITATTTSPVSKSLKIVLTRTGYSRTIGAWSTIRKAAPLSKTVVLGVPYAPKVAGSYSFKATAPAGVTYAVTVLQ